MQSGCSHTITNSYQHRAAGCQAGQQIEAAGRKTSNTASLRNGVACTCGRPPTGQASLGTGRFGGTAQVTCQPQMLVMSGVVDEISMTSCLTSPSPSFPASCRLPFCPALFAGLALRQTATTQTDRRELSISENLLPGNKKQVGMAQRQVMAVPSGNHGSQPNSRNCGPVEANCMAVREAMTDACAFGCFKERAQRSPS